jgi:hypothetical protein
VSPSSASSFATSERTGKSSRRTISYLGQPRKSATRSKPEALARSGKMELLNFLPRPLAPLVLASSLSDLAPQSKCLALINKSSDGRKATKPQRTF